MLHTCDKLCMYADEPQNRQECQPNSHLLLHLRVERVGRENELKIKVERKDKQNRPKKPPMLHSQQKKNKIERRKRKKGKKPIVV